MKKIFSFLTSLTVLALFPLTVFAVQKNFTATKSETKVIINGVAFSAKDEKGKEFPLVEIDGVLYVPAKAYTQSLGKTLTLDTSKNTASVTDVNSKNRESNFNTQEGFSFSNPTIKYNSEFGLSTLQAEITNNTKTTCSVVGFTCNFYDNSGNLKDSVSFLVNTLAPGQTKSFSVPATRKIDGDVCKWQVDYTF